MPAFHALIDAVPGREAEVADALRRIAGVRVAACREKSFDFLLAFEAPAFSDVDNFLQTHVRRVPGVKGVEVVTDWSDHGEVVRAARDAL